MGNEETFSWKGISVIVLIFIALIGGVIWIIYGLEKGNNERDKLYEELCSEAGLELYKYREEAPHYDSCYEINNGILKFYYLHNFKGEWYLREGLH